MVKGGVNKMSRFEQIMEHLNKKDLGSVILSKTPFSHAPASERDMLSSRGIVRGENPGLSREDVGELRARGLAEAVLKYMALENECTHIYGCRLIEVPGWDTTYGKVQETFYVMQGEGYGPAKRESR